MNQQDSFKSLKIRKGENKRRYRDFEVEQSAWCPPVLCYNNTAQRMVVIARAPPCFKEVLN